MNDHNEIVDIQTRLAYQEDLLNELNQIVSRQDAEILTLKQHVRQLGKRVEDFLTSPAQENVDISDERPPHY
jgi:SlyX protein